MFPMQERQLSLSSLFKNPSIMPLGVFFFFFFTEKNLFMEGTNSFLEELLPFGKRLKTREATSCFQQNSLDHRLSNRCWVYTSMIPYGYALIAVVSISTLHYWTFSLSLIDLGHIMGSQVDNSSNNHNPIMWKSPCICIRQADLCILMYS